MAEKGMRTFIAVELPGSVKAELGRLQSNLKSAGADLRLVSSPNLHLTLLFLGELDDRTVNLCKERLSQVSFSRFEASLGKVGVFPSEDYVRVIWVSVEPAKAVVALHDAIVDVLKGVWYKREKRFQSHVTLARVRKVTDKAAFVGTLRKAKVKAVPFIVDSFVLKKSTLTKAGPVYETIKSYELSKKGKFSIAETTL